MRKLIHKSRHEVTGRGLVYLISLKDNNLTPYKSKFELKLGDVISVDKKTWIIRGIESFATLEDMVGDTVGILVKEK